MVSEVVRLLDRPAIGALRASSAATRAAVDAVLAALAPPRPPDSVAELTALLSRLPALKELSLAACAEALLCGHATTSDAEAALAPLAAAIAARLPRLESLQLPVRALVEFGTLALCCGPQPGPGANAEMGEAAAGPPQPPPPPLPPWHTARGPLGAGRSGGGGGRGRAAALLIPRWLLPRGVARLALADAGGARAAWPDDEQVEIMFDRRDLSGLSALHIEHACLLALPPPIVALAGERGSSLRELRLHSCQIRALRDDALRQLTGLTSLQLSGACCAVAHMRLLTCCPGCCGLAGGQGAGPTLQRPTLLIT